MGISTAFVSAVALALAVLLTGVVRRFALSRGLLDVPNARSSHSAVTPRGGGVAIVLSTICASVYLAWRGTIPLDFFLAVTGGGSLVAAIGFMDDRHPIPARLRLAVHVAAAIWALAWIRAPTALELGTHIIHLRWTGAVLAVAGIVWALNLFNFMDGIDGIAACEAVFMAIGGGAVLFINGGADGVAAFGLVLGSSCLGFLVWNWPPAKIFMGDVGSGYLGYSIGVMGLAAVHQEPGALWPWLILGGVFFVDATVTLVRRSVRGDRIYEAHRSHAYQWLARRWRSHKPVTVSVMAVNLLWLLPCAFFAARYPTSAAWIALIALLPLFVLAIAAGAGRRENT